MFNIKVDYPDAGGGGADPRADHAAGEAARCSKVLSARAIVNLQKLVGSVPVSEYIIKYVARLVRATRPRTTRRPKFVKELVDWGAGPRAGQFLIHGGKALAAMDGRFSVAIDDVQKVAVPVLRHRISTNFQAQAEGQTTETLIERLLTEIKEPDVPKYEHRTAGRDAEGGRLIARRTASDQGRSTGGREVDSCPALSKNT